jgi:hypothetical protein
VTLEKLSVKGVEYDRRVALADRSIVLVGHIHRNLKLILMCIEYLI